jgi:hypothetical protein
LFKFQPVYVFLKRNHLNIFFSGFSTSISGKMAETFIQAILADLLTVVFDQSNAKRREVNEKGRDVIEFQPSKRLRMAKAEAQCVPPTPLPETPENRVAGGEVARPTTTSAENAIAGTPKFTTARKIAELKADRDHWKNLCLSSRCQCSNFFSLSPTLC